jgi:hypothetical protein
MKSLLLLSLIALSVACGSKGGGSASVPSTSEVLPGTLQHQITGTFNSVITYGGNTQSFNDAYSFDYNDDGGGNLSGRHNFQGVGSGFKKIAGTQSGNTFNYHSTECAGDTFTGSFSLTNGNGSFSGTVCGYNYQSGTLSGMNQVK